jgi:hypothetical protein
MSVKNVLADRGTPVLPSLLQMQFNWCLYRVHLAHSISNNSDYGLLGNDAV